MSDRLKRDTETSTEALKQSVQNTIEKMSVPEITALIEFARQTLEQKQIAARDALLAEFRERAASVGLSLDDLIAQSAKPARAAKAKGGTVGLPVKYRGPNGEEWSGRGRTPKWLTAAEAAGKKREDFAA
jgi:DNA-binding protein H-NS